MTSSNVKPITKADLDKAFETYTKNLATKKDLEEQTDALARVVNTAFEEQKDHFDQRFDKVDDRFDNIEERLGVVETKLDKALYIETTILEARITRLEHHVGLNKPKVPAGHKT